MSRAQPCALFPGRQRRRTHYQVLGISPDEQDLRVIEEAALCCSCRTRAYQLSRESECSLRLNEIALAGQSRPRASLHRGGARAQLTKYRLSWPCPDASH